MRVEYLFKKVRDNRSLRTIFTFNYIRSNAPFFAFSFCKVTSYCLFWFLFLPTLETEKKMANSRNKAIKIVNKFSQAAFHISMSGGESIINEFHTFDSS